MNKPDVVLIESASNPQFKRWQELQQNHAKRRQYQQALIEGEHLVSGWLARPATVHNVLVAKGALHQWSALLKNYQGAVVCLPDALFARLSEQASPAGLAAVISMPAFDIKDLVAADTVYCDRVQDPGNLGTIMRCMVAVGVKQLVLSVGCAQAWSPKVLRSAMGAHLELHIAETVAWEQFMAACNLPCRILDVHSQQSVYQADLKPAGVWVLGSEGQGLSTLITDYLFTHPGRVQAFHIPQQAGIESLNVAMAATVCLFEQGRQRLN
jgi:RNA methyltransferase, TrmH family